MADIENIESDEAYFTKIRIPYETSPDTEIDHNEITRGLMAGEQEHIYAGKCSFKLATHDQPLLDSMRGLDLAPYAMKHAYYVSNKEQEDNFAVFENTIGPGFPSLHGTTHVLPSVVCASKVGLLPGKGGLWGPNVYTARGLEFINPSKRKSARAKYAFKSEEFPDRFVVLLVNIAMGNILECDHKTFRDEYNCKLPKGFHSVACEQDGHDLMMSPHAGGARAVAVLVFEDNPRAV